MRRRGHRLVVVDAFRRRRMTLLCRRAVDAPRGLAVQSRCDALIEASRRIGRNGARPFAERPGMGARRGHFPIAALPHRRTPKAALQSTGERRCHPTEAGCAKPADMTVWRVPPIVFGTRREGRELAGSCFVA